MFGGDLEICSGELSPERFRDFAAERCRKVGGG